MTKLNQPTEYNSNRGGFPMALIQELPHDEDLKRPFERYNTNAAWFNKHGVLLLKPYRGRFVAVSRGDVFVGDSREEVERRLDTDPGI